MKVNFDYSAESWPKPTFEERAAEEKFTSVVRMNLVNAKYRRKFISEKRGAKESLEDHAELEQRSLFEERVPFAEPAALIRSKSFNVPLTFVVNHSLSSVTEILFGNCFSRTSFS